VDAPLRPASLTLATFNVHLGVDGWGRPFDVVAACRSLHADVLVLQESWAPEGGGPSTAEVVAGALGYAVVAEQGLAHGRLFDPVATTSTRWGPPMVPWQGAFRLDGERPGADGRRAGTAPTSGAWGLAVLSRLPVQRSAVVPLKKLRRDAAHRVVIGCTLALEGAAIEVFGTHMSHITHGSHLQYRRLRDLLPPLTSAAVLAGDMNLWGPPVNSYLRGWRRALTARTWPAYRPHSQLDHVLVTPAVRVLEARVGTPSGSDHLPVVATLAPA
jgi:endonuclease/exonuclease/phosphatase family metal-dependent hydrolase